LCCLSFNLQLASDLLVIGGGNLGIRPTSHKSYKVVSSTPRGNTADQSQVI
jgi:hypothetical protein